MYTIKHAAEVTGLSPTTLRAWERRYGVGTPHRTQAGYRLYDEDTVLALHFMAALVVDGWSPREAAAQTHRLIAQGANAPTPGEGDPVDTQAPRQGGRTPPLGKGFSAAAGEKVPQEPAPGRAAVDISTLSADELVDAAVRLDAVRLTAALDERFSVSSFESVVDGWLMPNLIALGEAWAEGRVSVAGEHLASYTVMRRLAAAYDASSSGATGARVMVGLPPGSRHELGVLAFAVAARRAGLRATYLGADLPAEEWVTAVAVHHARAVVIAALQEEDLPALATVVESLRVADPELLVAVGGARQDRAPQGCLRLGHEIGAGALLLAAALGVTTETP